MRRSDIVRREHKKQSSSDLFQHPLVEIQYDPAAAAMLRRNGFSSAQFTGPDGSIIMFVTNEVLPVVEEEPQSSDEVVHSLLGQVVADESSLYDFIVRQSPDLHKQHGRCQNVCNFLERLANPLENFTYELKRFTEASGGGLLICIERLTQLKVGQAPSQLGHYAKALLKAHDVLRCHAPLPLDVIKEVKIHLCLALPLLSAPGFKHAPLPDFLLSRLLASLNPENEQDHALAKALLFKENGIGLSVLGEQALTLLGVDALGDAEDDRNLMTLFVVVGQDCVALKEKVLMSPLFVLGCNAFSADEYRDWFLNVSSISREVTYDLLSARFLPPEALIEPSVSFLAGLKLYLSVNEVSPLMDKIAYRYLIPESVKAVDAWLVGRAGEVRQASSATLGMFWQTPQQVFATQCKHFYELFSGEVTAESFNDWLARAPQEAHSMFYSNQVSDIALDILERLQGVSHNVLHVHNLLAEEWQPCAVAQL